MQGADPGAALALPAYDQCLKASHLFNLLDARGVISVTERAAYIGRVRALARACCEAGWRRDGHSPACASRRPEAMAELLLSLLSEEIPARHAARARRGRSRRALLARRAGAQAGSRPSSELSAYVTPRRLTVIADGIPERQPDRSEERAGRGVGAPPQALDGFLRAAGLADDRACEERDTGRGEFYFARYLRVRAGRRPRCLPDCCTPRSPSFPWPKSMR